MNQESTMLANEVVELETLLAKNKLTAELTLHSYPITLTVRREAPEQMSLFKGDEQEDDEDATATWAFFDDELFFRIDGGLFTISRELRNRIERNLMKVISLNLQNVFAVQHSKQA